jgi:hypothetical protein
VRIGRGESKSGTSAFQAESYGSDGSTAELPAPSPSLTIDFPSNFYFLAEGKGLLLGWSDPNEPEGFNVRWLPR